MELYEIGGEFIIQAAIAGVDSKDLDIQVTPEELLIKAETHHEHKEEKEKVHLCEFKSGRLFRRIQFPEKIDPDRVKAEYKNGLLRLTAAIAKQEQSKKVEIAAS